MRYVRLVAAAVASLTIAYFAFLAALATRSGLSWREMDFDHDGGTSVGEFFTAADVSTRPVQQGSRTCTEYFLLKDGSPVKLSCPAG